MNQKSYNEEFKQQIIEAELEEEQYIVETFQRVLNGKNVTENDLKLVEKVKSQRKKEGKSVDSKKTLASLEKGLVQKKDAVTKNRKAIKKRRLNRDRLRRQRRLQDEKRKSNERGAGL